MKAPRRICVVTANRADYSRLKTVMAELRRDPRAELRIVAAGSHLLEKYGMTINEITADGFRVDTKVCATVSGDTPFSMAKSFALSCDDFASAFYNLEPDLVVVHGDRYEAFAAASAAGLMNLPIAHIQGGDVSATIDEHLRHAITKLAHFHFPSNERAKQRILKLGEKEENVFNLGCPGVDVLLRSKEMSFPELRDAVFAKTTKAGFKKSFNEDFVLMMYHPVTTEYAHVLENIREVLAALNKVKRPIVLMWPNIDPGSGAIVREIKRFERTVGDHVGTYDNFPNETFVNLMRRAKVMVGNSSAGIMEACYFGTPVVNIGTRQLGRAQTKNVISVDEDADAVLTAIESQLNAGTYAPEMPYGDGKAGARIAAKLLEVDLDQVQKHLAF